MDCGKEKEAGAVVIHFRDFGTLLGPRSLGAKARNRIRTSLSRANADETVVFDFHGVTMVSSSFADECFAKLAQEISLDELKRRTTFQNASDLMASIIGSAIADRHPDKLVRS